MRHRLIMVPLLQPKVISGSQEFRKIIRFDFTIMCHLVKVNFFSATLYFSHGFDVDLIGRLEKNFLRCRKYFIYFLGLKHGYFIGKWGYFNFNPNGKRLPKMTTFNGTNEVSRGQKCCWQDLCRCWLEIVSSLHIRDMIQTKIQGWIFQKAEKWHQLCNTQFSYPSPCPLNDH